MRKFTLAVAAASLAMPVALPAPGMAHDGYYNGKVWRAPDSLSVLPAARWSGAPSTRMVSARQEPL